MRAVSPPPAGLPPGDTWVLSAPETDRTMGLRNFVALNASAATGRYAPRAAYVELFLVQDGKPLSSKHYWGIYLLMEKIDVSSGRTSVTPPGDYHTQSFCFVHAQVVPGRLCSAHQPLIPGIRLLIRTATNYMQHTSALCEL